MSELKDFLEDLRKKHGTQVYVAGRLGITSQLLGQYEKGKRNPKRGFYKKWKQVFNQDIEAMIDESNVSREAQNGTHEHIEPAIPEKEGVPWEVTAFRKLMEDDSAYVLVSRAAFEGSHRFTSVEQVNAQTEQIRMLTRAFIDFVKESKGLGSIPDLSKIEEAQKNAGV